MGHIPISEENKRVLLPYKDALLNLASPNVPFKTKKRVLVQEGSSFIEDVLAPVVSSLGFLIYKRGDTSLGRSFEAKSLTGTHLHEEKDRFG